MDRIEEARWRTHVRSQAMSGLSQAVYCRIYGVSPQTFTRWRRRWWRESLQPLTLVPVRPEAD